VAAPQARGISAGGRRRDPLGRRHRRPDLSAHARCRRFSDCRAPQDLVSRSARDGSDPDASLLPVDYLDDRS
jgi:hypothetical protein